MYIKIFTLFLFAWSGLLFFSSGIVESQDGLQYLTIARQIYYTGSFEMPAATYPENNIHMNVQQGRDGKFFSPTGLGYSLSYLPSVLIEDVFNTLAGVARTERFPLEHDWPIMLFGSMNNAFFGALFITTTYLFFRSFNFKEKETLVLTFLLFISSNLFVYTKHGFAHMMFVAFMWLAFYGIRMYVVQQKVRYISLAAAAYGVVILTYNPTFILPLPALVLYYLASLPWKSQKMSVLAKQITRDLSVVLLTLVPFIVTYLWFNSVRFGGATTTGYGAGNIAAPPLPPAFALYEGLWGVLFSPGKSIFLFSPVLIFILLFWHKLKKEYLPEILAGSLQFIVYLFFIASLVGGEDYFPWHGEASFGPRYLLPIIPFALLLAALIYKKITSLTKWIVFWPLIGLGILIQIIGATIPYQVRFAGLEYQYVLNDRRITYDTYANLIPRWSPPYTMAKWFVKNTIKIPRLYFKHHPVKFSDGFHGALVSATGSIHQVEPLAVIQVDENVMNQVLDLSVINHLATSSAQQKIYDLKVTAQSSDQTLATVTVSTESAQLLQIPLDRVPAGGKIILRSEYVGTPSATLANQTAFVGKGRIGTYLMPAEQYNYPFVSPVSKALFGADYTYWGGSTSEPWDLWYMRSTNYVHTFDLWWLRPFHYWDLPLQVYGSLFVLNLLLFTATGYYLFKTK
jgi:hypothetical protein